MRWDVYVRNRKSTDLGMQMDIMTFFQQCCLPRTWDTFLSMYMRV
jgi:hypothetical protein